MLALIATECNTIIIAAIDDEADSSKADSLQRLSMHDMASFECMQQYFSRTF